MAETLLVWLVLGVVYVNCAVIKGKAFYCRDPDTGKLHAANTTWAASSFCGNYTCNIRRRNATLPSTAEIREFNVTNISDANTNVNEGITVTIEKKREPDVQPLLHKTVTPGYRNIVYDDIAKSSSEISNNDAKKYYGEEYKPKGHNCKKHLQKNVPNVSDEGDRYLTEKEIDKIADLLHTVKKSDLDAIVDIYNLAQDIYHEMDEITTEEIKYEALNIMKEEEIHKNHEGKATSYWYDFSANKGRMAERLDLGLQNTLHGMSTESPQLPPLSYFNERSQNNKKTPSNYPVTPYQRISSYTHPTHAVKATTQNANITKMSAAIKNNFQNKNTIENNKADSQKLIQPSRYLPYPFANIHPYNLTESRNVYYGSPWMLDYYNQYKYYPPYYGAFKTPNQKAVLINPHLTNSIELQGIEQQTVEKPKEVKRDNVAKDKDSVDTLLNGQMTSNWKTEPLPLEVLKDIRADIDTSRLLKAFPLRKRIKIERVGKLININDLNSQVNRNKRFAQKENVTEVEDFETYLVKVTCRDQIKLGYFRIGNLTQPFPECCPQLIDSR